MARSVIFGATIGQIAEMIAEGSQPISSVASEAAMLALPDNPGQRAIRTDLTPNQIFTQTQSPASTLANWQITTADVASEVAFTPNGNITETNVQTAVQGVRNRAQPVDSDLTDIAELTPANDDMMQRKAGAWANRTVAQVKVDLSLSGTNTGDQTITLISDVTGSGTGAFATTIANDAVTNAKLANVPTATFKGRTTAATGDPEDLTQAQATALLKAATASLQGAMSAADFTKLATYPAAFSDAFQASDAEVTTTSTTEIAAAALTFSGLVVGRKYTTDISAELANSSGTQNAIGRVLFDDTTEVLAYISANGVGDQYGAMGGIIQFTATATSHMLDFKLKSTSGASTAKIRRMHGNVRRVD